MKKKVLETNSLSYHLLKKLFNDEICVLLVREYASAKVCNRLTEFFCQLGQDKYTHKVVEDNKIVLNYYGVNRYGYPLNSTYIDSSKLNYYFELALPTLKMIRTTASPYLSPIDKLRVELDEVWPYNSNLATFSGKKMFCGIGRIMHASLSHLSEKEVHFDAVPYTYFPDLLRQYAANIYLSVPDLGGELEIWDVPPLSRDQKSNFVIPNNWRSLLPQSIKVKPNKGDLLLFNTCRPHAITKFSGNKLRVSIQTFIGLSNDSRLFLWD